eukprot:767235-Hanusia_phi.AAC.5
MYEPSRREGESGALKNPSTGVQQATPGSWGRRAGGRDANRIIAKMSSQPLAHLMLMLFVAQIDFGQSWLLLTRGGSCRILSGFCLASKTPLAHTRHGQSASSSLRRTSLLMLRRQRLRGGNFDGARSNTLLSSSSDSSGPEEVVRIHESNEIEDYAASETMPSEPPPFYSPESDEWPMDYFGESTRGDLLPSEEFLRPEMIMSKDEIINICQDLGLDRVSCHPILYLAPSTDDDEPPSSIPSLPCSLRLT